MRRIFSAVMFILLLTSMLTLAFNIQPVKAALAQTNQALTVGTTDNEASLDPANAYDYFGWEIIRSIGSGLVDYRPGATGPNDIIPDLATNWSVSSDGLQYTFSLRQGVKYDDGTEFNATHVKYTFDREMGIADPNGPFVGIGFTDIIQDVVVVDTYTVRFDLKIPFGPFLSLIAGAECVMVDPKYAPMHGSSWSVSDVVFYTEGDVRASNPMGLGPYTLSNWTRVAGKDSQMVLLANPNYWNASSGIPKTKNIIIKFYADSTGLTSAITEGAVDIAFRQLGVTDINTMKNNSNLKVWQGTGAFIQYLCFQEEYAPFNETNIRQAVGAAINRTALVNTVFQGQAQNLYSLIPIGMFSHKDAFQSLGDPNYTRTRELLEPYGYNETNKLTFTLWYETSGDYPESQQQAQVLKWSIEASDVITVNIQGLDWPAFMQARRSETMEAFIMGWYPDYIDADDYIFPFLDSSGSSWIHINYANPQMDQLVEWARGNTSSGVRSALYSQIQDLMVTDSPIIPLYQGLGYVVSKKSITGICLDMSQEFRYQLISDSGPTANTRLPGVAPGQFMHYKIYSVWNDGNDTDLESWARNQPMSGMNVTVLSVVNSIVTYQEVTYNSTGIVHDSTQNVDVETGSYSYEYLFIAANLTAGYIIYTRDNNTWINETALASYLGQQLETNSLSSFVNHTDISFIGLPYYFSASVSQNYYWYRQSGMLLEMKFEFSTNRASGNDVLVGHLVLNSVAALSLATGDLNLDGTVDISDAILAAAAFGSYPGHPNWNGQADLNHDNEVDIFDIIILANNFGKLSS